MQTKDIGLYLFAIGIAIIIVYGIYSLSPIFRYIDPVILTALLIILIGIVLIIVSIIREKGEEKKGIKKEDLEP